MTMPLSGLELETPGSKSLHNYTLERAACGFDEAT